MKLQRYLFSARAEINASDTFAYASADSGVIDETGIELLVECHCLYGDDGVKAFLSAVRKSDVIKPWKTPGYYAALAWLTTQDVPDEVDEEDDGGEE